MISLNTLNTALLNAVAVLSGVLLFMNIFVVHEKNRVHLVTLAFSAPLIIIVFNALLKINYTYFEISIFTYTLTGLLLSVNSSLKSDIKLETVLEIDTLITALAFITLQMVTVDMTERNLIFILVGLGALLYGYAINNIRRDYSSVSSLMMPMPVALLIFAVPEINNIMYWGNLLMIIALYRLIKGLYTEYRNVFNAIHFEYENLKESYERAVIQEAKKRTYYMERSKEKMAEISRTDHLTKALNKKATLDTIDRLTENRGNRKFAILMFDIDNFKALNDTYGHVTGDVCLKNLSNIVRLNKRDEDYFGRYGGDEFIIVLPSVNLETAKKIGERYRRSIEKTTNPHFSISMGIACYPEDAKTTKSLLEVADKGLYKSKEKGRNAVSHRG